MAGYVMIVESDAELQRQIGTALRDAGFDLHAEAEAAWAKRTVGTRVPDVVVVDTRLPTATASRSPRAAAGARDARRRRSSSSPAPTAGSAIAPRRGAGSRPRTTCRRRSTSGSSRRGWPSWRRAGRRPRGRRRLRPGHAAPTPKESLRDPAQQRERRDVERSAKSLAADADDAELQGTLKRTPFARLLQRLYAKRATGSLLLLRDTTKKIVIFAEGYPVSVRSNVLGETLGRILLEKRLITSEVLAESVGRHAEGEAAPGRDPRRDGGSCRRST
jgi:hypothetical protein